MAPGMIRDLTGRTANGGARFRSHTRNGDFAMTNSSIPRDLVNTRPITVRARGPTPGLNSTVKNRRLGHDSPDRQHRAGAREGQLA